MSAPTDMRQTAAAIAGAMTIAGGAAADPVRQSATIIPFPPRGLICPANCGTIPRSP